VKLKPDALEETDLDAMVGWNDASASVCVQPLTQQYQRSKARQQAEAATLDELKVKARCLERIEASNNSHRLDILLTLLLFAGMLGLLAMAFETLKTSGVYLVIVLSSLAVSGALGATVRMLTPKPPRYARWTPQVIGLIGGFFVGLLYLLPHLIGDPALITFDRAVTSQMQIQYLSVIVVTFLAGLGFEITLSQLLAKAEANGDRILKDSG
jgi:hypothetical protein